MAFTRVDSRLGNELVGGQREPMHVAEGTTKGNSLTDLSARHTPADANTQ